MAAVAPSTTRLPADQLGPDWVDLEEHAEAGRFAEVRVSAAKISTQIEAQASQGETVEDLRLRLHETIAHARNRAFEIGMEAVGRSFVGLYEAACKMQPESEPSRRRRRRQG